MVQGYYDCIRLSGLGKYRQDAREVRFVCVRLKNWLVVGKFISSNIRVCK